MLKIFDSITFMIHKVLSKFTKIVPHENLKPYGINTTDIIIAHSYLATMLTRASQR